LVTVTHTVYALKPDVCSGDAMIKYSEVTACGRCGKNFTPSESVGVAFMLDGPNWALCEDCYHVMAAHYPDIVTERKVLA
jgi:hypothetical protein